jgi:redox-sensitive bicupin YhaK (pirin superfamily)
MLWGHTQPVRVDRDAAGRETTVTVVAGALGEMVPPKAPPSSWASQPGSDLAIWTLKLAPHAVWTLPPCGPDTQRMLYYFRGEGMVVGDRTIPARSGIQLRAGEGATLQNGASEAELVLLQGRPIGEPVVSHGPFVMNTQAEIRQTFMDYQRTRFGGWPWASDGPTHPGSEGRFAKHVDGRIERPE